MIAPKQKKIIINTIQNKVILSTLLIQILISSITGIFLYYNAKNIIINSLKTQTIQLLNPLQQQTMARLNSIETIEDKRNYVKIVLDIQGHSVFKELKNRVPNLKEIYIYSDRKNIHTLKNEPLLVFPKLYKALTHKKASITFNKKSLYVNVPLYEEDMPLGGIIMEYSSKEINKEKQKALLGSILMVIVTFLIGLSLIKIFTNLVTKPLEEIITDLEEVATSGAITEKTHNYTALKNSEFEPLISGYINMKNTISQQINALNNEIEKRKKYETEYTLNKVYLEETIDEKAEAIKEINIMLKEEILRRSSSEKKLKQSEGIIKSLLQSKYSNGVLVLNNKGEVLRANEKLCKEWDLPENVVINDNEEQLIKYFSYQIIDSEKFIDTHNKCSENSFELGNFELKDGRKVQINYEPLKQENTISGKIFTFIFND